MREIVTVGREVASVVINSAVRESTGSYRSLRSYRRGAGVPARLENLFRAVSRGEMTPEEATDRAIRWLERDGELPPGALNQISHAFVGLTRYEQLPLLPDILAPELEPRPSLPNPAPMPRPRREAPIHLHVEVRRRSRAEDIEVTTEQ